MFLGVFVALSAENWNTARAERAMERLYLEKLEAELVADSATVAQGLGEAMTRKFDAYAVVAPYTRGRSDEIGDTVAFFRNVAVLGVFGLTPMVFNRATYDELVSTGNLRVFRNGELRTALARYYAFQTVSANRLTARMPRYAMEVHALIPAEARDRLDAELLRSFDTGRALRRIRSEAFVDAMNQEINYGWFARSMKPRLAAAVDSTLVLVRTELGR